MNANIISSHENGLFERKEVEAEVFFDGSTPKRADIKSTIGGKIGANPELMVLYKVMSKFGSKSIRVLARIYHNKEKLMATEPTYLKVREGLMEKPKKEAKKAAAPAKKK